MARLTGGLLGTSSGKIAGIVTGRWKNIQYARAYVVPAFTESDSQIAYRLRFKLTALFAIAILGNVLQPYMDKWIRGMSAFNWFIKTNIALFVDVIDYTMVKLTHGTLFAAAIGTVTNVEEVVTIPFSMALGSNGLATDLVYACVYIPATGRMAFAEAEVLRSTGTIDVALPVGTTGDVFAYAVTLRRDEDTDEVTKVSDSSSAAKTLA
jgi:hypothetical protein